MVCGSNRDLGRRYRSNLSGGEGLGFANPVDNPRGRAERGFEHQGRLQTSCKDGTSKSRKNRIGPGERGETDQRKRETTEPLE